MQRADYDHSFRIKLIGDSGVGKSCLLLRYTDDTYTNSHISAIGIGVDYKSKIIDIHDIKVRLEIWDSTAYQVAGGFHCIVVVYDTTDQVSFNNVKKHLEDIQKFVAENTVVLAVGAKCDLTTKKVIDYIAAKEYFDSHNIPFFETSAVKSINIDALFEQAATILVDKFYPKVLQEKQKYQDEKTTIQTIINKHLAIYQNVGDRFGAFQKSPQRDVEMQALVDKLKPIFAKSRLNDSDKVDIIKAIVTAKLNTEAAHVKNSLGAKLRLTSSRLAGKLTECLEELVKGKYLSSEQVASITNNLEAVAKNPTPKFQV